MLKRFITNQCALTVCFVLTCIYLRVREEIVLVGFRLVGVNMTSSFICRFEDVFYIFTKSVSFESCKITK